MSVALLTPFKSKAEGRQASLSTKDASAESPAGAPSKKQCTAYEKQLQKMSGDVSLVKDQPVQLQSTITG